MSYAIGFLIGLGVATFLFVVEIYLNQRNNGLGKAKNYVQGKLKPQGFIIRPKQKPVADQVLDIISKN